MSDYSDTSDNESMDSFSSEDEAPIVKKKITIAKTDEPVDESDIDDLDEDVVDGSDDDDDDAEASDFDIEDDEEEIDAPSTSEAEIVITKKAAVKKAPVPKKPVNEDEDEDDDDDNNYLQKFDRDIKASYINDYHPECLIHNYDEISRLTTIVRDEYNIVSDPLHKTIPFLTKYEKARVLGQRAKQLETGARPFIDVPPNIIDGYVIAEMELRQKKIPFIIKRPIPGGAFEYWNLRDLEFISV